MDRSLSRQALPVHYTSSYSCTGNPTRERGNPARTSSSSALNSVIAAACRSFRTWRRSAYRCLGCFFLRFSSSPLFRLTRFFLSFSSFFFYVFHTFPEAYVQLPCIPRLIPTCRSLRSDQYPHYSWRSSSGGHPAPPGAAPPAPSFS